MAMRAVTVVPGRSGSAELSDLPDPKPGAGELLVEGVALGVCATDIEISSGEYGWAPEGRDRLVLGHESLGRVRHAPGGSGFGEGDLVVGIVRRPDPVPCGPCGHGEFDMCRNGRYRERGIKELDGYCSELWTVEAEYAVRLDPGLGPAGVLMEPTSVVAKAWEQIDRIARRSYFEARCALVTGAGPIGLLAALLGKQRGLEVHVLDRVSEGPKPRLTEALGARYHTGSIGDAIKGADPDIVIEATGVGQLVFDAMQNTAPGGIVCLVGVSPVGRNLTVDAGAVNRDLVLRNDVVFGSVNANRRHYEQAATALDAADRDWLAGLITRRVPLDRFSEALERRPDDVKAVIELGSS
jgi:threonine dehydrogenase-like Zn-dependent dehydrogenase